MWNARRDESQAGIKIVRRNINNLRYADDTTLMAESEEELTEELLMRVKEKSGKAGLKLNIQKTKTVAPSPITSWQIEGKKVEAVTDFLFLGSKITVNSDCSHEIKRHFLAPWKKSYEKSRQCIKSRDITLLTKFHVVKAMVFPAVMNKCDGWTIKGVECWRMDAFELWCQRRLSRVSWTEEAKAVHPKVNQPWIFIGRTDAKAPILWPTDVKSWLVEKDPDAGKDWGPEEKGAAEDEMVI